MKFKHLAIMLAAAALIAITFAGSALAQTPYYCYMAVKPYALLPQLPQLNLGVFVFTIDTSTASDLYGINWIYSFGHVVDRSSLVLSGTDSNGKPYSVKSNEFLFYSVSKDGNTITFAVLSWLLPAHVIGSEVDANLLPSSTVGTVSGDTITASGPGWTWGGHT